MSNSTPKPEHFDVFLCHNSEDKAEIRHIADELSRRGLSPWLDEREIPPGKSWQAILETQIETIKAAAVFVGKSGIGPWQNMEMRAFINEFVERACPVIPVILPSAMETPKLPILLKSLHWVDFRKNESDPLDQLVWGVTGEKPSHQETPDSSTSQQQSLRAADGRVLLPSKEKQVIEVRLPGNLEEFTAEQQITFMQSLSALLKIGEVKVTRVVAGSIRLYLELNQEDADKLYSASKEGQLAELSISEARLYPAIAVPPDHEQRAQLLILLDRVQEYWIDGVLKNSLHREVLISLGKRAMDEAVEPPWKHVVALPSARRHLLLQDRNINTVFDATGLLLILGEPGSGKTTSLLELAAALAVRAKSDPKERVPIVLNLSSWKKRQSITEWIGNELSAKYRIPMSIARDWLSKDYLVPLLDGLDEVQTTLQPDCVAAINEFIESNKSSGLVVCCRLKEYRWLPERLRLNGAICLEPLSTEEANEFLEVCGPQLTGLRQALKSNPLLQELAESPLMLSIMSLTSEGVDAEALSTHMDDSPNVRRDQMFRLYVDRMFERKGLSTSSFSKDQTINWLSWLARKMREQSQSVLMVEGLQPSWLSSTGHRLAYETATALSVGWLVGWFTGDVFIWLSIGLGILLGCRTVSPLKNGIGSGLGSGLVVGLGTGLHSGSLKAGLGSGLLLALFIGLIGGLGVGSLKEICLIETMRWQWKQFWEKTISSSIKGIIVGLIAGLIAALIGNENLLFILWCSGAFGMIGGLTGGLVGGLSDSVRRDKTIPNQGVRLSYINGMVALLICLFSSMLLAMPLFFPLMAVSMATLGGRPTLSEFGFGLPLFMIFEFALSVGLNRGGSAVVKHYALRLILWLTGATPFRFIPFLDHCAKLILLKKVGGGYIFIHRTLLEYFAALPLQDNTMKKASPSSAP